MCENVFVICDGIPMSAKTMSAIRFARSFVFVKYICVDLWKCICHLWWYTNECENNVCDQICQVITIWFVFVMYLCWLCGFVRVCENFFLSLCDGNNNECENNVCNQICQVIDISFVFVTYFVGFYVLWQVYTFDFWFSVAGQLTHLIHFWLQDTVGSFTCSCVPG